MKKNKTNIICTIGPASNSKTILKNMMLAGMDVARINCSHGSIRAWEDTVVGIRELNARLRHRRVRILVDLEGYRIRAGSFKNGDGIPLKKKQRIILTNKRRIGDENCICLDYPGSLRGIKKGMAVYFDDGNISLSVLKPGKDTVQAEVVIPGFLKEHKGVNIPGVDMVFSGVTEKDANDISFALKHKVDYIAQSFVRDQDDMTVVRSLVYGSSVKLIAKIENRQGINNIERILSVSDGIMIARGDMGVSLPVYEIPVIQKELIKKCNRARKFVITATQMLESMTEHLRPTRAEVTDVANAIFDGSDFVMLSAETAAGSHPVESVDMMHKIITFTEHYIRNRGPVRGNR
ncbi:MAG: pyruvate kinase [Candidatus Omnitrophica bacterium]|nr:pyruvate kinase [Candidatus Omnitrophota bacterium]